MLENIINFMRKRYIGVDLLNGKVRAFEKKENTFIDEYIGQIFPNIFNPINNESYWYDINAIEQLLNYVLSNAKKSLFRPGLVIAIPFEISDIKNKVSIVEEASKFKWSNIYILSNFMCAAIGSGIQIEECRRKIFIYSLNDLTYFGLVFAGNIFNVKILKRGYNELTQGDIINNIGNLTDDASKELPEQFTNIKLSKKDLEEVTIGWKLEIERTIYLSIPTNLKNVFGLNIGKYQLVYLEYENCIIEGLKNAISKLNTMKIRKG